jgi:hypothetical protein
MKVLGSSRLIDVLVEWGSHNTEWRIGRTVTDGADAAEVALTYYAQLVGRVLSVSPMACFLAELDVGDVPVLVAVDGRAPLADWAAVRARDPGHAGRYIRAMVDSPEPVVGPLICACAGEAVGEEVRIQPPLVVFDGCHRGAAWVLRGSADPIAARLIVTERPP